jgi:acetyltransferase-like isoleucine patch superfamily enzyme
MRIQIKQLSKADRFKCKFGIFNITAKFGDFHVKIGRGSLSSLGSFKFFPRLNSDFDCLAVIGDFCEFADTQILLGGEHPNARVASTFGTSYEVLLTQSGSEFMPVTKGPILIDSCCVFGVRTTVLSGSKIGNNSLIAAGALITGVQSENAVLMGVPAVNKRDRLSQEDWEFINRFPWWTASYDWIIKSIKNIQQGKHPEIPFEADPNKETSIVLRLEMENSQITSLKIEGLINKKGFLPVEKFPKIFKDYLEQFDGLSPVEIDTNILKKCYL